MVRFPVRYLAIMRARERRRLSSHHWAWVGTPSDLVRIGNDLKDRVLPGGEFEAVVTMADDSEQVADAPADLGELDPSSAVARIELKALAPDWPKDDRRASVDINRILKLWIHVTGRTEVEAQAMLDMVEKSLQATLPRDAAWRASSGRRYLVAWILALILLLSTLIYLEPKTVVYVVAGGWLVLYLLLARLSDWLLPSMELHAGRARVRRFGWGLFVLVLLPFIVGLAAALIVR
jgi:hypothetical protein